MEIIKLTEENVKKIEKEASENVTEDNEIFENKIEIINLTEERAKEAERKAEERKRTGTENHTEGKAMFEVMRRLVKNSKKRSADFQSKLPACLQEMTEKSTMQKKFPCTICGKLFPKIEQLITHSHEHGPVRIVF